MLLQSNDLMEEYKTLYKTKEILEAEQKKLPKGSIQKKTIHGVICYYLVYRESDKIKSMYINKNNIEEYNDLVERRREIEKVLKDLKKRMRAMEKSINIEMHMSKLK